MAIKAMSLRLPEDKAHLSLSGAGVRYPHPPKSKDVPS
jgi:hypothetical protein